MATKIKDYPTLEKNGNAVINIDDDGYQRALQQIKYRKIKESEMANIDNRISKLENEIGSLNSKLDTLIDLLNR